MTNSNNPSIAIVGSGNVGGALACLFHNQGFDVILGSRDISKAQKHFSPVQCELYEGAVKNADLVLLTVPDYAIKTTHETLLPFIKTSSVLAHCSGSLSSEVFNKASNLGHAVCSLHPLNTFPNISASKKLFSNIKHKTSLFCEGDKTALDLSISLFEAIGFIATEITIESKPLYHAACVIACNYMNTLIEASKQTAVAANIDENTFMIAMRPILNATLQNITKHGTSESLSGPLARGEGDIIENHIERLHKFSPQISDIYTVLAKQTLPLVIEKQELSEEKLDDLTKILSKY